MRELAHMAEIEVNAAPEAVWDAITNPELDADAHGHWGPLAAYRDLGYETYRELPQRLVLRRALTAADHAPAGSG